jgi:hypothetical protein
LSINGEDFFRRARRQVPLILGGISGFCQRGPAEKRPAFSKVLGGTGYQALQRSPAEKRQAKW